MLSRSSPFSALLLRARVLCAAPLEWATCPLEPFFLATPLVPDNALLLIFTPLFFDLVPFFIVRRSSGYLCLAEHRSLNFRSAPIPARKTGGYWYSKSS